MTDQTLLLLGSLLWGLACAGLAWAVLSFLTAPLARTAPLTSFELSRRERLRQKNSVYRWFEPGVERMTRWNARKDKKKLARLSRSLALANPLPWKPEEYLALRQVEGFFMGLAGALFGWLFFGNAVGGLIAGAIVAFVYANQTTKQIHTKSQRRLRDLKRRLPFTIDLMALMMGAGASFQESLTTAIRENIGHPVGEEFTLVLRDITLGRARSEALLAMQHRLADDDVAEIVFAVNKGEELGTPLSLILSNQAEQMRLKRSQWLEKAAGEAEVNIVFPGMIIMLACLLIVLAPFILAAVFPQ